MSTLQRQLLLYVELDGITPPIWRRLRVRDDLSLADLHLALQAAMGWEDSHLYEFDVGGRVHTDTDPYEDFERVGDVRSVRLSELDLQPGDGLVYTYDLGDSWRHVIGVEEVGASEPGTPPAVCVDGARRCPPEDCGGVSGYEAMLAALRDPERPEHEEWEEWIGPDYDPERFSTGPANAALAALFEPGGRAGAVAPPLELESGLEDIAALMEAGIAGDERIPRTLLEMADRLLRCHAVASPDEFLRTRKLEGWAAGALHAACLLAPYSSGTPRLTLEGLADRFGVSAATIGQRSQALRYTAGGRSRRGMFEISRFLSGPPFAFTEAWGESSPGARETDRFDEGALSPRRAAEELLEAAEDASSAVVADALYLAAVELLETGGWLIDDEALRHLLRRGLETASDPAFSRFLALAIREFGLERAAFWVPWGEGRGRGARFPDDDAGRDGWDPDLRLI